MDKVPRCPALCIFGSQCEKAHDHAEDEHQNELCRWLTGNSNPCSICIQLMASYPVTRLGAIRRL